MAPRFNCFVLFVLLTVLGGCAGSSESKAGEAQGNVLPPGPWRLASWNLEGPSIPAGVNATLSLDDSAGNAAGIAGCNQFSGAFVQDGEELVLGPFILTKKLCMEPDGVMAFEQAYVAALEGVKRYTFDGQQLVLHGDGELALVFALDSKSSAPVETTRLDSLQDQVGAYPRDIDLWNNPAVAGRLQALLGGALPAFLANMEVQGPVTEEDGLLYVTGNKAHEGGAEMAAFIASPALDQLQVWLVRGAEAETFAEKQPPLPDPSDVQALKANLESAP